MQTSNLKRLAIIPARSGSKGLSNKNILPFAGKPLMNWTIEAALESKMFSQVFLSTNSQNYADIAKQAGLITPYLRPEYLSLDNSSTLDVVLYTLDFFAEKGEEFDQVAVLQPTSPLRNAEDIKAAFTFMTECGSTSLVSVSPVEHPPSWIQPLTPDSTMKFFVDALIDKPRQAYEKYYQLNGAIYISDVNALRNGFSFIRTDTTAFIMSPLKSVDIDNKLDFEWAQFLMNQKITS